METFEGKTFNEALQAASKASGKSVAELKPSAHVIREAKTLFSVKVIIGIFTVDDVFKYACGYLSMLLDIFRCKATYQKSFNAPTNVLTIEIISDYGSKIIGKNGETLKALNTLVRSAVFNVYGGTYRILLDCDNYKSAKYLKISALAKSTALDVQRSHIPAVLPPMSSDERRIVHEALSGMVDIDDPSVDDGKKRHIVIKYVPGHVAKSNYDEK